MAVSTSTNKGLESPNDKKAILTTKTWDEFISIGRRIGAGNSVVFSSAVAWENNGFGTSYPSGKVLICKGVPHSSGDSGSTGRKKPELKDKAWQDPILGRRDPAGGRKKGSFYREGR